MTEKSTEKAINFKVEEGEPSYIYIQYCIPMWYIYFTVVWIFMLLISQMSVSSELSISWIIVAFEAQFKDFHSLPLACLQRVALLQTSQYCLKTEVFIMLHFQSCSTHYTAALSISAFKVTTMENTSNFHYEKKPSCATTNLKLFAVSKDKS